MNITNLQIPTLDLRQNTEQIGIPPVNRLELFSASNRDLFMYSIDCIEFCVCER